MLLFLQLEENARQWGKEKSQLTRKLQEAELERDWSPAPEPRPLVSVAAVVAVGRVGGGCKYKTNTMWLVLLNGGSYRCHWQQAVVAPPVGVNLVRTSNPREMVA